MELRLSPREREALARGSRAHGWVLAVWDELARPGSSSAGRNLSETFARVVARERGSATERASAARAVRALVRHQPRLRHATDSDDPSVWLGALLALTADGDQPDPRGAARWRARDALLGALDPAPGGARPSPDTAVDPAARLAALASLPPWLAEAALRGRPPGAAAALARHLCSEPPLTLRANRLRGTREQAMAALAEGDTAGDAPPREDGRRAAARAPRFVLEPTGLSTEGVTVQGVLDVTSTRAFRHGWVEFQDEASQLVAELVAPPERGLVVDACAGAGGKTLALGARMGNRGRLVALDPAERRLTELARRAKRAGLHTVERRRCALGVPAAATPGPALAVPAPDALADLVGRADRVLVDAPCTGVGALRRKPELLWHLDAAAPARLAAEQTALVEAASALVKPGGRLVYATCTVLIEECEAVVHAFLARHPEFVAVPVREVLGRDRARAVESADGLALASWTAPAEDPRAAGLDGFFAVVLRRSRG